MNVASAMIHSGWLAVRTWLGWMTSCNKRGNLQK
uniref:Uncharacterized protein n=1 Tax=Arundo donax TaxID=35708 RepID=A0A0A8YC37_ARUDO